MNAEPARNAAETTLEFTRILQSSNKLIPDSKAFLTDFQQQLTRRFLEGENVVDLVYARSNFTDAILKAIWQHFMPESLDAALVAVGGYGRGELHPASDIDLMILLAEKENDEIREKLEQLLMFFWDIGLEVGHSVRTLDECVAEATADITVATNIMEARLLSGSEKLFTEMKTATSAEKIWSSEEFFLAKTEEQSKRHKKYGDTAYNLEPNIKENPGGLRDIQMIGWVAKRHFAAETMHDLVVHGFLTDEEFRVLQQGEALLWKIRFALHINTGRREDRLLFDQQRHLAKIFGYAELEGNQGIEKFMQKYYRTVIELNRLNEMLLQLFQEAIILRNEQTQPIEINEHFHAINGYLDVRQENLFSENPVTILEVFTVMASHPELSGVRASTIRLIRQNRHRIDVNVRNDPQAKELFIQLFKNIGLTREIRRMNRYGVLAAYLPVFDNIVGRMQYDLFHVYTVDAHTLFVIRNLRRLTVAEHQHEFPLSSSIINSLSMPHLVYLAALFHDIAKGRGGDHAELGAHDAEIFCQSHGLSRYEIKMVSWLVRKHLLMSMTAQRKDIDDPEVIQAFASQIIDPVRLDFLYLLTVADARATNPARWNDYKDSLLKQLYNSTRKALHRGLENPQNQDEVIQLKQEYALNKLHESGFETEQIHELWITLTLDYFLHSSPDEIVWQSRIVLESDRNKRPIIEIRRQTGRGGTEIFVCTDNAANIFSIMTILLARLNLKILSARINSPGNNCTMNSFIVHEQDNSCIDSTARTQEIIDYLREKLAAPETVNTQVKSFTQRQIKNFESTPTVSFSQDNNMGMTQMRLTSIDKAGLLAEISQVFIHQKIKVHSAKISTVGADVEDTFFITDRQDRQITDPQQLETLEHEIIHALQNST